MTKITSSCGLEAETVIDMSEFTDNVTTNTCDWTVSGTGILDILLNTTTEHLKAQFHGRRIKEEDYANMYVQLFQSCLATATQIWLQKGIAEIQMKVLMEDLCLKQKQLDLLDKQSESEDAKKDLYRRQIEGFDEDYKMKILAKCLDTWSVGFSVARDSFEASGIPVPMTKRVIDDLFNNFLLPEIDNYKYKRNTEYATSTL